MQLVAVVDPTAPLLKPVLVITFEISKVSAILQAICSRRFD